VITKADITPRNVWPRKFTSRLASIIFFATMLSGPTIGASPDHVSSENPWRCDGHLLPDLNMSPEDAGGSQEAISYLYVGAHGLKNNYLAAATFTLPRTSLQRGWYANSIVLKTMGDEPYLYLADASAQQTLPFHRAHCGSVGDAARDQRVI